MEKDNSHDASYKGEAPCDCFKTSVNDEQSSGQPTGAFLNQQTNKLRQPELKQNSNPPLLTSRGSQGVSSK